MQTRSFLVSIKLSIVFASAMLLLCYTLVHRVAGQDAKQPPKQPQKQIDPKAWGSNHAGKPIPEFVHGDECLFCHRNTIGSTWQENAHGATLRHREDAPELVKLIEGPSGLPAELTGQIEYFLGGRHRLRFLKKEGYGRFSMLNAQGVLGAEGQPLKLIDADKSVWEKEKFGASCAGCHTTAVDPATKAFTAFGLDCYVCHGDVNLDHTKDISLMLLSKKQRSDAKMITSICAQCHLRDAKSRSTGLPYPNTFIAGDNLFQDLEVDFTKADDAKLNAGDRHIWRNARDVALLGDESINCLSCHAVHANNSQKHRRILRAGVCSECHAEDSFKNPRRYTVQSKLCEY